MTTPPYESLDPPINVRQAIPSLLFAEGGSPTDVISQAVCGKGPVVADGKIHSYVLTRTKEVWTSHHARTSIGFDRWGTVLDLVVVVVKETPIPGNAPGYCDGVSVAGLAEILGRFGVADAIYMGGGGEAMMAMEGRQVIGYIASADGGPETTANQLGIAASP